MKLFLVHLGYYPAEFGDAYEAHMNVFVVADDVKEARRIAKARHEALAPHVDSVLEIAQVGGYRIDVMPQPATESSAGASGDIIHVHKAPGWVQAP